MTTQQQQPRIYLAGPEVFFPNALAQGEEKKRLCAEAGFEGVYPLDNIIERADWVGAFGDSRGAFAPPQCDIGPELISSLDTT